MNNISIRFKKMFCLILCFYKFNNGITYWKQIFPDCDFLMVRWSDIFVNLLLCKKKDCVKKMFSSWVGRTHKLLIIKSLKCLGLDIK